MVQPKIELKTFTQTEILLAADTLNTTASGKRRILVQPDGLTEIEVQLRPLPNSPGLLPGEIVPGVAGYLYNLPVFVDSNSDGNYMV